MQSIPPMPKKPKTVDISYTGRASHPCRPRAMVLLKHATHLNFEGGLYRDPRDHVYKMKVTWGQRTIDKLFPNHAIPPDYEVSKLSPMPDNCGQNAYYDQIYRSKIALSLRGGGLTPPIRYYEIIACKRLLLSDMPYSIIPHNFIHGKHAVFFKRDMSDLIQLAEYYTRHDSEREIIVENGYQHLIRYHTCEKRAEYLLDICRKAL